MPSKPPVLPADLSGAAPISAQIPVRVFPCFHARDPGAPPLIGLSRVILEASRKSFVGLDRYAAADLLRPILAEFGLRGCTELTCSQGCGGIGARGRRLACISKGGRHACVAGILLASTASPSKGHRRDFRSVASAGNTTSNNTIAGCYFF